MLKNPLFLLAAACASFFTIGCSSRTQRSEPAQLQSLEIKSFALIDEEITNTIAQQMQLKCATLFPSQEREIKSCSQAAVRLAAALNFNYIRRSDGQGAFVFMRTRLKEMLTDRASLEFISKLTIAAEDALYLNKKLDLWDFTLRESGNSAELSTERLAVLIQDGAETAAQIKYLLVAQHPQALQLAQMVSTLEEALKQGKASAYPAHVGLGRAALYHYYVPRYLAQKLKRAGTDSAMAARLPFIFNASYELRQIQKAQNPNLSLNHKPVRRADNATPELKRFVDKWNSYDELYSDLLDHLGVPLEPFDPRGEDTNMQDIFLGYVGGLDGVGGVKSEQLDFRSFMEDFSANPKSLISLK